MVLLKQDDIDFNCRYESAGSTTAYTWYLDRSKQSVTTDTFTHNFAPGSYEVTCQATIREADNCFCNATQTITITVVSKLRRFYCFQQCLGDCLFI